MFVNDRIHELSAYYYRPSLIANDTAQQVNESPTMGAVSTALNPSGKTWEDFLPRDWYSSAVYRNILDMLNTLIIVRTNLQKAIYAEFFITHTYNNSPTKTVLGLNYPGSYETRPDQDGMTRHVQTAAYKSNQQAFWGFAAKKIGAHGDWTIPAYIKTHIFGEKSGAAGAPNLDAQKIPAFVSKMNWAGYKKYKNVWLTAPLYGYMNKQIAGTNHEPNIRIRGGNGYSTTDLVSLVRSLDWEMNRVHLPLPFNLRQWTTTYNQLALSKSSISFAERFRQLIIMRNWLTIMQEKVRKAIDASNLAVKVAEQSLRNENAAIVKANAEEKARLEAERAKQIETERIAAQKMLEAQRAKLAEEMRAMIAKEKAAALKAAADEIKQAQTKPVAPISTQPQVTTTPVVSTPAPIPSAEFKAPVVYGAAPTIIGDEQRIPLPVTPPSPIAKALPLLAVGAALLLGS